MGDDARRPVTSIVGLGNVLMADDAFGPYFVNWLQAHYELPDEIEVADLGTPGLDLYPHLVGRDVIVVVDTVRSEGAPGECRLYRRDDILRHSPPTRISPHDPGLKETLLSLEFAGKLPEEVILAGVVPASTEGTIGLSPTVAAALRPTADAVVAELRRLGFDVRSRLQPLPLELWWERQDEGASS